MPANWIEHKGKKVLHVDCRQLEPEQFVADLQKGADMMAASPTKVLYLVNIEGATVSREVMGWFREKGADLTRKNGYRFAVVGASGVQKVMVDAAYAVFERFGARGRSFKTEQEALDWLVE